MSGLTCERCGQPIFWGFPRPDDPCPECGGTVRIPANERSEVADPERSTASPSDQERGS